MGCAVGEKREVEYLSANARYADLGELPDFPFPINLVMLAEIPVERATVGEGDYVPLGRAVVERLRRRY